MPTPSLPIRGFHLDLKGLAPTIDRLPQLLTIAAAAGYNAALVEWEDMFPWSVDQRFRAPDAYTTSDVQKIHQQAAQLGIDLIPLVQCLGHMETPLSLRDYVPLRQIPQLAGGIDPLATGSRQLIQKMVDDVLSIGPKPRWFHLGGDEAWTFGRSDAQKHFIASRGGPGALYLHHVEPILDHLIAHGIRPILWHDMMSNWEAESLPRIAAKADLMVWGYAGHPDLTTHHYRTEVIERFHAHHVPMWGACAFKGADGPSSDLPNPAARFENTSAWVDVAHRFNMRGVVATAWSRYSTHYVQCEPIDGALDVFVAAGRILTTGRAGPEVQADALTLLDQLGERQRFDACHAALKDLAAARGSAWSSFRELRELLALSRRDPRRRQGGPASQALHNSLRATAAARRAANQLRTALHKLLPPASIEEFLAERLEPLEEQNADLQKSVAALEPQAWEYYQAQST